MDGTLGLFLNLPDFLLDLPFDLFYLALDLFRLITSQFAYLFSDLSLDLFAFSFKLIIAHDCST